MEKTSKTAKRTRNPENSIPEPEKIIPNRFELQTEDAVYDFGKCLEFMEGQGKKFYGNHFGIWKENHQLIYKLLVYAIGDKKNAEQLSINLRKGILLTGPVGCGKTCLMNLLKFFQKSNKYILKSCREISFEFIRDGYKTIEIYSSESYYTSQTKRKPRAYCFDDLGTEQNLKYYGNECNVMAEILLSRYDRFVSQGMMTHLTSNLSAKEIEDYYGSRVRSRMREMFNLISFDKEARDKRV